MGNDKCLLCERPAEIGVFATDPASIPGNKYVCETCGLYALDIHELHYIENHCTREERLQLSEYVKNHPGKEGNYKVLTMAEIRQVLNLPDEPKS